MYHWECASACVNMNVCMCLDVCTYVYECVLRMYVSTYLSVCMEMGKI